MEFDLKLYVQKEVDKNMGGGYRLFWQRYISPGTNAVYMIRKMQHYWIKGGKINQIHSLWISSKLAQKYGIFVSPDTRIGIGLKLPHPNGIVIGKGCVIGENCTIFQQVTIGSARNGDFLLGKQPHIKDNVCLFAGCKILGNIIVGNGCTVGANSVLLTDADDNGTYVGSPARIINK